MDRKDQKDLPFRKRKLDKSILEELGILPAVDEQGRYLPVERQVSKFNGNLLPESAQRSTVSSGFNNSYHPKTAPVKTSQGSHAVGEQGIYLPVERRVSKFNENLLPESAQRSTVSSGFNNSYHPKTAPVKTSQGSHAVGEQGIYLPVERRVSKFKENLLPESSQRSTVSSGFNNNYHPKTAPVKTSQGSNAVREQGRYLPVERRVSKFKENLLPESSQRSTVSSGFNNSYHPKTAPVKTSQGSHAVGEQGRYLPVEKRVSKFNKNLLPESAQRSIVSSGFNNSYHPKTAPVKTSQGSHDTDGACEGMTKTLAACSTDAKGFRNPHRVPIKDADEDVDKLACPRMPSYKAAPVASERIWEGSMQFDFNTKVPMLAFFKSGQKLLDINWSSSMEIKGKMALKDFKNFIRYIPYSKHRKLMVISLCWKQSSSTAAHEFLKSAANWYGINEQVLCAKPSADINLYMYPWNEEITTILVNCGYLEEKAVIADRSELLIGCVVWKGPEGIGTYSLKEQERKSPTGKYQTTTDTLLRQSDKEAPEPLKEQGFKSLIGKDQNNSVSLMEQSKNRGTRLLKEHELSKIKGVEPLKKQGSKSSIGKGQNNSGPLLEKSNNREVGPLKKRKIGGARMVKEQEIWSPLRVCKTSSGADQGLKFRNEHLGYGRSNLLSKDPKGKQPVSASTTASVLRRTITVKPLHKVEETAVGGLDSSLNKIAVSSSLGTSSSNVVVSHPRARSSGNIKPSLTSHFDSLKTTSRNLPVTPGPSKFPISLESSNKPRQFRGSPLRMKICPPIPNKNNSLSRYFTFSQSHSRP